MSSESSPNHVMFHRHATHNSGALSAFDRNAATLRFAAGEILVLLRPTESFHHHGTAEDAPWPVLRGAIELDLPRTRQVSLLEVEVVSKYELRPPWGKPSSGILYSRKQVIDTSRSSYYTAGTHHFVFEFPIDPSTAPFDSTPYGRVYQRIVARAPGLGAFNSDATASLVIAFLVIPAPLGEMPPSLEWRHQAYSSELGPYSLDVASDALMVSALLNFRLRFHDPPLKVHIHGVVLSVVQTVELQYGDGAYRQAGEPTELLAFAWDGGRTAAERTADGTLVGRQNPLRPFDAKTAHTCTFEPGVPKEFSALGQLPADNWLRPTTFPGTRSPIKMSHVLKVSVFYRDPFSPRDMRQMIISRPVEIASCCSIANNLILPEYGAEEKSEILKTKANVSDFQFDCACGMTLSSLVKQAQGTGLATYWDEPDRAQEPLAPKSAEASRAPSREPSQSPSPHGSRNPSRDVIQAPSPALSRAPSRDTSRAPSRDTSQLPSRDTSRPPSRESYRVPLQSHSRASSRDPSRARSREPSRVLARVASPARWMDR